MKFRVDFVTNSSSDSTVMVFIKRKDGQYIVEEGDTSPFEEGRLEIRNGKLYADDEQIRTVDQLLDCLGFFSDLDGVKKLKDIAEIGLMDVEQEYGESISNRYSYQLEKAHPGEFEEDCQNGVTSHVVKKWEGYLAALFGDKILNLNEGDIEGALETEDMDLMFPECIYVKGYPMETLDFSDLQEASKMRAGTKPKPPQQAALKQSDLKALFADVIWERGVDYARKKAVRNLECVSKFILAEIMRAIYGMQASKTKPRNLHASLSQRVATRRNSLSLRKKFSTRWRSLYSHQSQYQGSHSFDLGGIQKSASWFAMYSRKAHLL